MCSWTYRNVVGWSVVGRLVHHWLVYQIFAIFYCYFFNWRDFSGVSATHFAILPWLRVFTSRHLLVQSFVNRVLFALSISFLVVVSVLTCDTDIAILSVCPSVCLSVRHVQVGLLYRNDVLNISSRFLHYMDMVAQSS